MEQLSVLTAFGTGILSFLSPCVLPLVPVYFASICGPEILEPHAGRARLPVFLHSLSFVVGFSAVFVILGAGAGLTGLVISPNQAVLNKITGILLIAFGLFMLVALKVPRLNYERRLTASLGNTTGYARSLLIGAIFTLAWTACVGPILGGILTLAFSSETAGRGAYLLAIYSLGLGLPFLIIGFAFDSMRPLLKRINRHSRLISAIAGLLLIAVGVLALTNKLIWFSSLAA